MQNEINTVAKVETVKAAKCPNRGKLLRLALAGKLVCVQSYGFDDQYGEDRSDVEVPVRIKKSHDDYVHGACNLIEWDFKTKSGCAYLSKNGTITMVVHSNSNYTFKILP